VVGTESRKPPYLRRYGRVTVRLDEAANDGWLAKPPNRYSSALGWYVVAALCRLTP